MAIYCGLGNGKGWETFCFQITPAELSTLLLRSGCKLLITNKRVSLSYDQSSLDHYVQDYKQALETPNKADSRLNLMISLALPGSRFSWQPVTHHRTSVPLPFKVMDMEEPMVSISPMGMHPISHLFVPSFLSDITPVLALELHFPKVYFLSGEGMAIAHTGESAANGSLYSFLVDQIKSSTSPLTFITPSGVKRTRARISDSAKKTKYHSDWLSQHGVSIK